MIHHLTFTDENMTISAAKCSASAKKFGCDTSIILSPKDYTPDFLKRNKHILTQPRGAGYWLWKPYIIDKMMTWAPNDSYLIYTDAGILFENYVSYLITAMDSDIMLFGNRWKHGDWCKMDCLRAMKCTDPVYTKHEQLQASCIIVKNTLPVKTFIYEWLAWGETPDMIDDSESFYPNLPGFREHRHDQAILTNLAFLYRINFHWWPVQYCLRHRANYPRDKYPIIFQHHRKRNNEW